MRSGTRFTRLLLSTSLLSLTVACGLAAIPSPGVAQGNSPGGVVAKKPRGPADDPELIPIGATPVPIAPAPYDPGAPVPAEDDGSDDGSPYPPSFMAARVRAFARKKRVPFTNGDANHPFNIEIPLKYPGDGHTSLKVEYYAVWNGHKEDESVFVEPNSSITPADKAMSVTLTLPTKRFSSDYALVRLRIYNPAYPKKGQHCWIGIYGTVHGNQPSR